MEQWYSQEGGPLRRQWSQGGWMPNLPVKSEHGLSLPVGQSAGEDGERALFETPEGEGRRRYAWGAHLPRPLCSNHEYQFPPYFLLWKTSNIALTKASFVNRDFLPLYFSESPSMRAVRLYVQQHRNCEDIAMQMMATQATGLGPERIMLTSWYKYVVDASVQTTFVDNDALSSSGTPVVQDLGPLAPGISAGSKHRNHRSSCLHLFAHWLTNSSAAEAVLGRASLAAVHRQRPVDSSSVLHPTSNVAWLPSLFGAITTPGC